MDRRKLATLLVVLFTIGLAGVAVFTAVRLYQQRQESVAPTAPTSIPRAQEATPTPAPATTSCEVLSVALAASPTPTGAATPTATPTITPTPTSIAQATPTAEPELPEAGIGSPTILGVILGLFAIAGAIALAF